VKTLLISGCSYGIVYSEIEPELKDIFEVDRIVNLSSAGASPDRQIRVVIEWIAQNGKPDMVIMPVSHYNRFDLPIAKNFDPLHNLHLKASWQWKINEDAVDTNTVSIDTLKTFMKTGAMVYQIEHTEHDKLFVKLITFQAYLELNKIRHLIFDTGNYYEKQWMEYLSIDDENNSGYQPGMKKRDLIENSPGIYRLLSFCSNVWMYEQLTEDEKRNYVQWTDGNSAEGPLPYPLRQKTVNQLPHEYQQALNEDTATINHRKETVVKLMKHLHKEGAIHG
jgi:hypothetical protein